MGKIYIPVIAPEDFDAFKKLLGPQLSMSYDEWIKLSYTMWHPDHLEEDETIVDVKVYPDEFARYLKATRSAEDLKSLLPFAEAISKGTRY
jgi:hypothetical protein